MTTVVAVIWAFVVLITASIGVEAIVISILVVWFGRWLTVWLTRFLVIWIVSFCARYWLNRTLFWLLLSGLLSSWCSIGCCSCWCRSYRWLNVGVVTVCIGRIRRVSCCSCWWWGLFDRIRLWSFLYLNLRHWCWLLLLLLRGWFLGQRLQLWFDLGHVSAIWNYRSRMILTALWLLSFVFVSLIVRLSRLRWLGRCDRGERRTILTLFVAALLLIGWQHNNSVIRLSCTSCLSFFLLLNWRLLILIIIWTVTIIIIRWSVMSVVVAAIVSIVLLLIIVIILVSKNVNS